MKIRIWQNLGRDSDRLLFLSYDEYAKKKKTRLGIDRADYTMVYEDCDQYRDLEDIFTKFNLDSRPNGKGMRSLSMGDIVEVVEGNTKCPKGLHYVDEVGFTGVKWIPDITLDRALELAQLLCNGLIEDDRDSAKEYFLNVCSMTDYERGYFGVN